jgi:Ribbon-helix-helix protein, copG family
MSTVKETKISTSVTDLNSSENIKNKSGKRMSISLTGKIAESLDLLAKSQGITQNEALRKAIGTECYIREELDNNSRFVVIKSDGREADVIFR